MAKVPKVSWSDYWVSYWAVVCRVFRFCWKPLIGTQVLFLLGFVVHRYSLVFVVHRLWLRNEVDALAELERINILYVLAPVAVLLVLAFVWALIAASFEMAARIQSDRDYWKEQSEGAQEQLHALRSSPSARLRATKAELKKIIGEAKRESGPAARSGHAARPWIERLLAACKKHLAPHQVFEFEEQLKMRIEQTKEESRRMSDIIGDMERTIMPWIDSLGDEDVLDEPSVASPALVKRVQDTLREAATHGVDRMNDRKFGGSDRAAEQWCADFEAFVEVHLQPNCVRVFRSGMRENQNAFQKASRMYGVAQEGWIDSIQSDDVIPNCDPPNWRGWSAKRRLGESTSSG